MLYIVLKRQILRNSSKRKPKLIFNNYFSLRANPRSSSSKLGRETFAVEQKTKKNFNELSRSGSSVASTALFESKTLKRTLVGCTSLSEGSFSYHHFNPGGIIFTHTIASCCLVLPPDFSGPVRSGKCLRVEGSILDPVVKRKLKFDLKSDFFP